MPDLPALHARIVAAAKRWYAAVGQLDRWEAEVELAKAVRALLEAEGKAG